jgi:hypothetical protein
VLFEQKNTKDNVTRTIALLQNVSTISKMIVQRNFRLKIHTPVRNSRFECLPLWSSPESSNELRAHRIEAAAELRRAAVDYSDAVPFGGVPDAHRLI